MTRYSASRRRASVGCMQAGEPQGREAFGLLLRQTRLNAGLTQAGLAENAGLSLRAVQHLEGAHGLPYPDTARRLADALGLEGEQRSAFEARARRMPSAVACLLRRRPRPRLERRTTSSVEFENWRNCGSCTRRRRTAMGVLSCSVASRALGKPDWRKSSRLKRMPTRRLSCGVDVGKSRERQHSGRGFRS